jgi:lactoylglutathione lyase
MGYDAATPHATIELTWNWDQSGYTHGSGFGHVALEVEDVAAACERIAKLGGEIIRPAGQMSTAPVETGEKETIAFLLDPDGYKIELIETPADT